MVRIFLEPGRGFARAGLKTCTTCPYSRLERTQWHGVHVFSGHTELGPSTSLLLVTNLPQSAATTAPSNNLHLWIRAESRATERRAPIIPDDAATLVQAGVQISVEESPTRVFATDAYAAAGCHIVAQGSWPDAPADAYIVGIKELPDQPYPLRHTHIYFAHAFKGQSDAATTLARFAAGGGELLDVEYLTIDRRRVVAFGYWAGYVGAGLGVLAATGSLPVPLVPWSRSDFDDALIAAEANHLSAVVMGAMGRSGSGAQAALAVAGVRDVAALDRNETANLDRADLLGYDLLVNCVASSAPMDPFVTTGELAAPDRRLATIADVTCDVTSEHNLLPINTAITTWDQPVRSVGAESPIKVIAIDNLPSLLPREASVDFSAQLTPLIADLPSRSGAWRAAEDAFNAAR